MSASSQAASPLGSVQRCPAIVAICMLSAVTISGCATFGDYSSANPEPKPKPQVEDDTPLAQKIGEAFVGVLSAIGHSGWGGQVSL